MLTRNKKIIISPLLTLLLVTASQALFGEQTAFSIKGDSSSWDIPNNQMKYFGNAVFSYQNLLLEGDELIAQKSSTGNDNVVVVNGSPAHFTESQTASSEQYTKLSAKIIRYLIDDKTITAEHQVHLQQKNERNEEVEIHGEKLTIHQGDNYRLTVSGKPMTISILRVEQEPISAEASQLNFDKEKDEFEMVGAVVLRSTRETMRAEKVLFNMKTGILEVPKSPNTQVEIIQSQNNEQ